MAARVAVGIKDRVAYLRRLSVVFAVELRLRIVTELSMREMSPKQFHQEFGGSSESRIRKNFEKLEEHGWLRRFRTEGPGGSRRGATEHFYRTTELAVFDDETWALLPLSIRISFSWRTFKQLGERFRYSMENGTFDARPDRHHSCTPLLLDELGWGRVTAAIDALFLSSFDEQGDAKLRMHHSGEAPMVAGISLVAFEAPPPGEERAESSLVEAKGPLAPFHLRLSKVLKDEVCLRIVEETNQREMSAAQFHREFGGSRSGIHWRFKLMEDAGWVKQIRTKTKGKCRNGKEKFFRAAGPAVFDDGPWADVPPLVGETDSWKTFEQLSEHVKEAMKAETFDARTDRYLTWSLLLLDHEGWEKLAAACNALHGFILDEAAKAKERMARSGGRPVWMTVGLAMFESPTNSIKEW